MKKSFLYLHNDSGFYFPIVLVIIILVTSFLTMILLTYNNNITITNSLIDDIKVNSIIQMVDNDFSNDITIDDDDGELTYFYPNGHVDIIYKKADEFTWNVKCEVFLENKNEAHQVFFPVSIDALP